MKYNGIIQTGKIVTAQAKLSQMMLELEIGNELGVKDPSTPPTKSLNSLYLKLCIISLQVERIKFRVKR